MAVSNVKDGYIDWSTVKKIDVTDEEISRYRLLKDDVLITEGGDPDKVGRGAIIKNPLENCIHQNHIFRVRLNKLIVLPVFFAEYLQHQKSKRVLHKECYNGILQLRSSLCNTVQNVRQSGL